MGGAGETTGVDLDEVSIEQAKHNANLNQVKIRWVHQDAYIYARQMKSNNKQWDVVVIDPPKFVASKIEFEDGRKKYRDLNQLAISLLVPGGLLVTCSCSGLMPEVEFEKAVVEASSRLGRRLQFIKKTGAGPDHPIMSNFPESQYLKVLWARAI